MVRYNRAITNHRETDMLREIAMTANVDLDAANQILEKLWAQGIDMSECTQKAFKAAVMEAKSTLRGYGEGV